MKILIWFVSLVVCTAPFQDRYKACRNSVNFQSYNSNSYKISSDSSWSIRARMGVIRRDTASTEEIIANRGLRVELKGYPKDYKFRFEGFTVTFIDRYQDSIAKSAPAENQFLNPEQIKYLRKLNGNGKIIFQDIRVIGSEGKTRELSSFSLVVKG